MKIEIDVSEYIQLVYDNWKLAALEEEWVDSIISEPSWDSYEEVTNIVTSSLE